MGGDDYVEVECRIIAMTDGAIRWAAFGEEGWCPRSCLHGASDIIARKADPSETVTLKMREWKARELGLI